MDVNQQVTLIELMWFLSGGIMGFILGWMSAEYWRMNTNE